MLFTNRFGLIQETAESKPLGTANYPTQLATDTCPEPSRDKWRLAALMTQAGAPASTSFQSLDTKSASFTGDLAIDHFCIN